MTLTISIVCDVANEKIYLIFQLNQRIIRETGITSATIFPGRQEYYFQKCSQAIKATRLLPVTGNCDNEI